MENEYTAVGNWYAASLKIKKSEQQQIKVQKKIFCIYLVLKLFPILNSLDFQLRMKNDHFILRALFSLWNEFFINSSVQFSCSVVSDSVTPWTAAHQASLSITNYQSLPKLMSTEAVMPSNHLILCHPLLLLPSIFPSIKDFSNESALCIRWPKYWSFSFNISPSNEHPGLISFRMDGLDLLAVQGTLKSRLQHHSSKT